MAALISWEQVPVKSNRPVIDLPGMPRNFAVGNDLVYLPDFQLSCTPLFKKKVYTESETAYCELFSDSLLRYASTWAAKEAVYKAVKQVDKAALGWKKIEILRAKPSGKPTVNLVKSKAGYEISLSISHDGEYVWAVALLQIPSFNA